MMSSMQNNAGTIDRAGQQLGNYRLVCALSLGRTSGSYLGEHIQSRAQYLVNVWEMRLEKELIKDFLSQSRALGNLLHPHILPVRDANVDESVPFVVMEYVPHVTLRERGSRGRPQPLASFLPSLKPIAEALQYAHNQGFLHKHVRPANILLDNQNRVLVSNFGIDAIDRNTLQPLVLTKEDVAENLGYIAPEQIEGKAFPASDQYGLAVVIYEWLSGVLPFRGSYAEVARQHKSAQPPSLHRNVSGVSRAVEETIFTALAKDPARRFPSISRFVEALHDAERASAVAMFPAAGAGPSSRSAGFIQIPAPAPSTVQAVAAPGAPQIMPAPLPPPATPVQVQSVPAPYQPASKPAAPTPAARQQQQKKPGITRRAFVAGLLGAAVLGGGAAWLALGPKTGRPLPGPGNPGGPGANPKSAPGNIFTYYGHRAHVRAVSWSPDGKRIASASDDHLVLICDAQKGKTLLTYRSHSDAVLSLAWSPDGRYIASAGADKTVQVWDAASGRTITTYTGHTDQVNAVSWSHQGNLIASGSDDRTVQVWNATTQAVLLTYTGHTAGVLAVAWSPDDTVIATGSWDNTVQAFSTVPTQSFKVGGTIFKYGGHSAEVYAVAWSPDGKRLASASGDKLVYVQDGTNGSTIFKFSGHSDIVYAVAWAPDGNSLVSGSADTTAQIWSARQSGTSRSLFTYTGHSDFVYSVDWSPDGKRIASGSADDTVQVWHRV